nr:YgjP-like metallopeptidase domain-containing protein [Halomonas neptunia]
MPNSSPDKSVQVIHEWHKRLLHKAVPPLIQQWESKLEVTINRYYLKLMKTKWEGWAMRSCRINWGKRPGRPYTLNTRPRTWRGLQQS